MEPQEGSPEGAKGWVLELRSDEHNTTIHHKIFWGEPIAKEAKGWVWLKLQAKSCAWSQGHAQSCKLPSDTTIFTKKLSTQLFTKKYF